MNHKPAEAKEDDASSPEYPLVLLSPSLNHANSVSADTQRRPYAVEPFLRAFQDLSLLPEVSQDSAPPIEELI